MILKAFAAGVVVLIASSIWLYLKLDADYKTYEWVETPATIGSSYADRNLRGKRRAIHTPVKYQFNKLPYEGVVDDFLVPGEGVVFVNPDAPTQVVGVQGPNLQHIMRPLIGTVGSALFLLVLILIRFSPSED